ncbi:MAG TPA: Gfo/Idh/MocA family oxidoreductase [Planctomycetota bacterium]|nr:Gfo/Idh/MocA family oxidoreductase [Planctomycetota bacterium]
MSKVRIGFVGVGTMGQMAHLANYVTIDACEVVAIAELRTKTAKLVAQKYGVPKVYADHREMLTHEKLDGIVASQPFARHAVLLPELYPRAKYLFTEKPLAIAVESGQKLVRAAADAGCTHMVGYNKRSDPATIYARSVIDEWKAAGGMGPLRYVRILMPAGDWIASGFTGLIDAGDERPKLGTEPPPGDMDEETARKYVSFVNYYIHQVNLMRHLLGEPYHVTYAEKSGVVMAVESESGVPGVVEMTPYRTTVDWQESALVAFEKGYVKLDLPAPMATHRAGSVEVYSDPGDGKTPERTLPTLPWVHSMKQQAVNFLKVCKGEMDPPCDAAEALEDLKVARDYIRLRLGR